MYETTQNTKMSNEEHSDSGFYNRKEQETAERQSCDKVEASGDTGMKS